MLYANAPNPFRVDVARELLKEFDNYTTKLNADYCMVGGTLLGYVRHGTFMSWDDDIDLLMLDKDLLRLWEAISLKYDQARIERLWEGGKFFDWFIRFERDGTAIDVWPWKFSEDKNSIETFIGRLPTSKTFPYRKVPFEGASYCIPNDPFFFLDYVFSDWKTHIVKRVDGHEGNLISTESFFGSLHHQPSTEFSE